LLEAYWLEARYREPRCGRQQNEVARLQRQRPGAVHRQATAALEHRAEARLAEGGIANAPAASAADGPREHRTRLQQGDDFRERVIHVWTIANKLWTRRCRTSGFFTR